MATIGDVAQAAGVSRSTASYALSGKRAISADVRRRVEDAVRELGYTPNAGARALATSQTMVIGLLAQFLEDEFAPAMLQYMLGVSNTARELGYDILLVTEADGTRALRRITDSRMVDGVVLLNVAERDERLPILRAAGQPGALVGLPADCTGVDVFDLDFEEAGRLMVDHLHRLGHREVALVSQPEHVIERGGAYVWRLQNAAVEAARARGITLHTVSASSHQPDVGQDLNALLDAHPAVTGLLINNEAAAAALPTVLHAARADRAQRPVRRRPVLGRVRPHLLAALLLDRERSRPARPHGRAPARAAYRGRGGGRRGARGAVRDPRAGRPRQHRRAPAGLTAHPSFPQRQHQHSKHPPAGRRRRRAGPVQGGTMHHTAAARPAPHQAQAHHARGPLRARPGRRARRLLVRRRGRRRQRRRRQHLHLVGPVPPARRRVGLGRPGPGLRRGGRRHHRAHRLRHHRADQPGAAGRAGGHVARRHPAGQPSGLHARGHGHAHHCRRVRPRHLGDRREPARGRRRRWRDVRHPDRRQHARRCTTTRTSWRRQASTRRRSPTGTRSPRP